MDVKDVKIADSPPEFDHLVFGSLFFKIFFSACPGRNWKMGFPSRKSWNITEIIIQIDHLLTWSQWLFREYMIIQLNMAYGFRGSSVGEVLACLALGVWYYAAVMFATWFCICLWSGAVGAKEATKICTDITIIIHIYITHRQIHSHNISFIANIYIHECPHTLYYIILFYIIIIYYKL